MIERKYLTNGRENWNFEDFEANDPKALEMMQYHSIDEYNLLATKRIDNSIKDAANRIDWTYNDYSDMDPDALAHMEKHHRQKHSDLYNAHVQYIRNFLNE